MRGEVFGIALVLSMTTLFLTSTIAYAQQTTDWSYYNGNKWGWNYAFQNQIGKQNAQFVEVKWVFPVPANPGDPAKFFVTEGVGLIPLVYKGVVYFMTNWNRVYALDAKSGKTLWFRDLSPPADWIDRFKSGPFAMYYSFGGHYHQQYIFELGGKPYIAIVTDWYELFLLDPLTGDIRLRYLILDPEWVKNNVVGNRGVYHLISPNYIIDTKRNILVTMTNSRHSQDAGRAFIIGVDLGPWVRGEGQPRIKWITYTMPPQDGSDPMWSINSVNSMKGAWAWDGEKLVDLKAMPDDLKMQILYDDWGFKRFYEQYPNEKVSYAGGAGAGFGGMFVADEERGLTYVYTNQPGPFFNATFRPGPNLWSDSILAIDTETGRIVWAVSTHPHDLWDWDCAWNIVLAKNALVKNQKRDVLLKACKNGVLMALDPDSGSLLWAFNPWHPERYGGNPAYGVKPSKYARFLNPLDPKDMNWRWQGEWETDPASSNAIKTHQPIIVNPGPLGAVESDIAYDPERNYVFIATYNIPYKLSIQNCGPGTQRPQNNCGSSSRLGKENTTIYAIDVNNGRVVWEHFIPDLPFRGGLTTSNGLVFVPLIDGTLRILDADNGRELKRLVFGGYIVQPPSIAADVDGKVKLFLAVGGAPQIWGPQLPGFVVALGLPEVIAERTVIQERTFIQIQTQTQVITQLQTSVVTQVQTQVREVEVIPAWVYGTTGIAVIAAITAATIAIRGRRK
ncbi:MAG: PQQ-binding-like beta-propeller repeat protein [Aigarchaeota archaeon]|nr:PQQ-binding-like beta-propeller repeat protein [Candidatus Calditenuis fumarioli]